MLKIHLGALLLSLLAVSAFAYQNPGVSGSMDISVIT